MNPPRRGRAGGQERPKDVLDIAAVLLHYGADTIPASSGWRKMKCIHGERNPSATVNTEEGAFNCFSCGLKGDAIAIIRTMENCSYLQALAKYKEITGQDAAPKLAKGGHIDPRVSESKNYETTSWLASKLRKGI